MTHSRLILITLFLAGPSFPAWGAGPGNPKLEQEVADLRRIQEINNVTLAEAVQGVSSLRQEIQAVRGALEENRHFIQEESQKNERILREFDYRLTGIEERLSLFQTQLTEFLSKAPPAPAAGAAVPAKPGTAGEAEGDLYKRALTEINLQNHKQAILLFDQFMQKYPKSSLSDNAQYWKAEALYGSKDYPTAILEFQKVIQKHKGSEKIPGAILKQGYCFYEMKNYMDAKAFLQKVATDFPQSDEAAYARERIAKIEKGVKALQ